MCVDRLATVRINSTHVYLEFFVVRLYAGSWQEGSLNEMNK